jgi:hypothetical protein
MGPRIRVLLSRGILLICVSTECGQMSRSSIKNIVSCSAGHGSFKQFIPTACLPDDRDDKIPSGPLLFPQPIDIVGNISSAMRPCSEVLGLC